MVEYNEKAAARFFARYAAHSSDPGMYSDAEYKAAYMKIRSMVERVNYLPGWVIRLVEVYPFNAETPKVALSLNIEGCDLGYQDCRPLPEMWCMDDLMCLDWIRESVAKWQESLLFHFLKINEVP